MFFSHEELVKHLDSHHEWLLENSAGRSFALRRAEIELEAERERLLLGFLDDGGWQTWRVTGAELMRGGALRFDLSRAFGRVRERVRLVPRAEAAELGAVVELARLEKAERLARALLRGRPKLKLHRVSLNQENGRLAQIVVEHFDGRRSAVLSDVSESMPPESLLSCAVQRVVRAGRNPRNPIDDFRVAAPPKTAAQIRKLHALLAPDWKKRVGVMEIAADDAEPGVVDLAPLEIDELWRGKVTDVKSTAGAEPTETAKRIVELAPGEIDVVRSRHGESLRWLGLPFARVRSVLGRERLWFGAENPRRPLTTENAHEFDELLASLAEYRRGDSPSRRHYLYRTASEAWLEALLRRNVRMLDANLVLAPVHHQFRAGRERVDLLALRRDGRLVIIEIKTEPDRDMVYQAADYWRRLEHLRRRGKLREARLFGALDIADAPPVCYLLAPTLSYHRDAEMLAATLRPEIRMHRFCLAENWRERFRIIERR